MPAAERFWRVVQGRGTSGCWLWQGATLYGYGTFTAEQGKTRRAHRFAYELLIGPIPDGYELDHLREICTSRACVKVLADAFGPAHLEPVTRAEHAKRHPLATKTHCKRGHELFGKNLYIHATNGKRICRTCTAMHQRLYQEKRRRERAAS